MPTWGSWKVGLDRWKWRPYKVRLLVSNPIYSQRTNVPPPLPTYPALSAEGHCWRWHHELESYMTFTDAMGPTEFNPKNLLKLVAGSWYCMHRCKRVQLQCKYMDEKLLLFADTHLLSGCNLFFDSSTKRRSLQWAMKFSLFIYEREDFVRLRISWLAPQLVC